jgi:predicted neuraminidase
MILSLRLLLILLAWGACAVICRHTATLTHDFHLEVLNPCVVKNERPVYQEEFINEGQDLEFVHVSSVVELADHSLAALWYGGDFEYSRDNSVFFARKQNGLWKQPHAVMTTDQVELDLGRPIQCLGNPLLLPNPDGSLRLLFVTIAMGRWSGSQLNTVLSRDGGLSWSRTERLTLAPLCNFSELVRNRPVRTDDGWCVPIYQEFLGKFPELLWLKENNDAFIFQKTRIAGGCSTLQPSLIPLDHQRAVVLLRDYTKDRKIFRSTSGDGGLHWSKPMPTNLPNPDAGISGLRLSDGDLLVAFNDSPSNRGDLSLALSHDEGRSWKKIAEIENDWMKSFSYPYLMQSSDGMIHLVYIWDKISTDDNTLKMVKMVSFNEAWIKSLSENSAYGEQRGVGDMGTKRARSISTVIRDEGTTQPTAPRPSALAGLRLFRPDAASTTRSSMSFIHSLLISWPQFQNPQQLASCNFQTGSKSLEHLTGRQAIP